MSKTKTKRDIPTEERRTKPRMEPYKRKNVDLHNLLLSDDWDDEEEENATVPDSTGE